MYGLLQKHKQIAALIIAVASLSFLFWMFSVSDIKQMFGLQRCVAVVEGSCITPREFRYELLKYSDVLDKEEFRSLVKKQVAYSLINREAVYIKARELGIFASSKEVVEAIKNDPSFQEDGKFNFERYRSTLDRVGLTPKEYETILRKSLTVGKFVRFLSEGVYITDYELDFQREILSVRLRGKAYLITPSSIKVHYEPKEEELREFYAENKGKFAIPESREYRLWELRDKERAHSIYSSLKKGKIPEGGKKLAREGLSGLPEQVTKAVEGLSFEERFTLTKVKDTYYVVYLESYYPMRTKSFEEAKEEVKKAFLEAKKVELLSAKARELRDSLLSGNTPETKPVIFEDSSVEEFIKLFNLQGDEVLKLVFSGERVFGPYRVADGYAVLYIDNRKEVEYGLKNLEELKMSLLEAKAQSLISLFADKLMDSISVEINEEYLK